MEVISALFKFKFKFNEISSEAGQKPPNGLYSRLYYSFQKYISIHYDITITLNTSGSKWTGSIIIYEFQKNK